MTLQEYNDLFKGNTTKALTITASGGSTITNQNIVSESMSIESSLCSELNLRYGSCESTCFKIRLADLNHDFTGESLNVQMAVTDSNNAITTVSLGTYKVYSDKLSNDRRWRDLTCYDAMYDILNTNVITWFNGLTFPMTIRQLRDSFFTYLGITQETASLTNDTFIVQGGFSSSETMLGKDIIKSICEMNAVFGHINTNGNFEYIDISNAETLTLDYYVDGTGSYEDYTTDTITGVIARGMAEDVGTSVGTTVNPYIIEANPLVYGSEGTQDLEDALDNILDIIETHSFRPFSVQTYGNPMLPLGTKLTIQTRNQTIVSYVINKTMSGIQGLRDSLSSKNEKTQKTPSNNLQSEIVRTKGQVHEVKVLANQLYSAIYDSQTGIQTEINQLSDKIVLKVQSDGTLALCELDADPSTGTTAFIVKAGNFSVDAAGNVTISGNLTSKDRITMSMVGPNSGTTYTADLIHAIIVETQSQGDWSLTASQIVYQDFTGQEYMFYQYAPNLNNIMTMWCDLYLQGTSLEVSGDITAHSKITGEAVYTKSDVGDLGRSTYRDRLVTNAALAFWNGAFSGTSSNLQYCDRGRFGTASIVNTPISIANGGTGASDRLNAVKNLTNQNVSSNATHFLTITTNWGKAGYSDVNSVKSVLNMGAGASGNWFNGRTPNISNGGVIEVGKYIDFHTANTQTNDYTFRLTNTENAKLTASGTITQGSSKKIKENIKPIDEEEALKILELEPVSFDYKEKFGGDKDHRGFIAEDVAEILPNLTSEEYGDEKDLKSFTPMSLSYNEMIPYLVKVNQIQQKKIESLEERISKLEGMIETLMMKGEK